MLPKPAMPPCAFGPGISGGEDRSANGTRCFRCVRGITIVELLVAVAVIATLLGLLLPAITAIRESGRLMQCRGNLRELARACASYTSANGHLPTPGNSGRLGRSTHPTECGWLFLILPFVEQQPLYDLGASSTGATLSQEVSRRVATPVEVFTCTNRGPALFTAPPVVDWKIAHPGISYQLAGGAGVSPPPPTLARTDFAGCWENRDGGTSNGALETLAGRGRLLASIIDGQANAFLCGERFLPPAEYRPAPRSSPAEWVTARRECNNKGWSVASEGDVYAAGTSEAVSGVRSPLPPLSDATTGVASCLSDSRWAGRFGSPHRGVPMAMVDGSVHVVRFDISPAVFADLCNVRNEGNYATVDDLE